MDLYEYGFRWYDAAIGRFTGVDPIADEFAWVSPYNYAENEPVAHIDLHGLQKWKSEILNAFPETDEEWRQGVSQGQSPKEVSNNQGGDETSFSMAFEMTWQMLLKVLVQCWKQEK